MCLVFTCFHLARCIFLCSYAHTLFSYIILLYNYNIINRLVAFTCVLALCNLGTSFAAAFLAKDTTTVNGKFVDSHTGNTLKTDSSATTMAIDNELTNANRRQRRLACEAVRRLAKPTDPPTDPTNYGCTVAPNAVSMEDGEAIVNGCRDGGAVNVVKNFNSGNSPGPTHTVCQLGVGYSVTYDRVNGAQGAKYPTMSVVHNNQQIITIIPNEARTSYEITGLYSQATQACDIDADCVTGLDLTCESNVCTTPATTTTTTSSTAAATTTTSSRAQAATPDLATICAGSFDSFVGTSCDAAQASVACSWTTDCGDNINFPTAECTCENTGGEDRDGNPIYNWMCLTPSCPAPDMDEQMTSGGMPAGGPEPSCAGDDPTFDCGEGYVCNTSDSACCNPLDKNEGIAFCY